MHSWDYSGPYHGYDGFAIFARDMDIALSNPLEPDAAVEEGAEALKVKAAS
jgi:nitrogenase molybdenum-iron protein alpha/beta subunit